TGYIDRMDGWHGLWHASLVRGRGEAIMRAVLYLGTPLVLTLVFGAVGSLRIFATTYLEAFVIGGANVGVMDAMYQLIWPRLIREPPAWPTRIAAPATTLVATPAIGSVAARALLAAIGWDEPLMRLWVQSVAVGAVIVAMLVVID